MKASKISMAAGIAALTLATSACSLGGSPSATSTEGGTTTITVVVSPIVDAAPLYLGIEKGFFSKRGLDVKVALAPTPGARLPSLISGASQFGLIGTADILQGAAAGVPIRAVTTTTVTTSNPADDTGKVYVAPGSSIAKPSDLNGKTIGVGSLGGGGELSLRAALEKAGADTKQIKFLEVPLDSMLNAVKTGQVDAISSISPFTNAAESGGAKYLMSPGAIATAEAAQSTVVTTETFLKDNSKAAKSFIEGLNEGTAFAAANPQAVRDALPTFSKTPKEVAAIMQLPVFKADLNKDRIRIWSELMIKYGFVKGEINLDTLVVPGG